MWRMEGKRGKEDIEEWIGICVVEVCSMEEGREEGPSRKRQVEKGVEISVGRIFLGRKV